MKAVPGLIAPANADAPVNVVGNQIAQVQAAVAKLTVVATDGVKAEEPSVGVLDKGIVDLLDAKSIEHDFILRNDTKAPITIDRLQPTCGCTSVLLGEGNDLPKTLAPGEQAKVHVSVDITRFHGPIHKAVQVYGADGGPTIATLQINADITDPVAFSVTQIDFGHIQSGTSRTVPLAIILSPHLVAKGITPKLVSSNPDVQVTPIAINKTLGSGNSTTAASGTMAQRQQFYNVTVSAKAPLGPLTGTIALAPLPNTPAPAAPLTGPSDAGSGWQIASVPLVGEVDGKLTATPHMVFFGTAKDAKQQVVLSSATPQILKNLKITPSSPWVIAHLVTAATAKSTKAATTSDISTNGAKTSPATAILELSLSPRTPLGSLNTQVIITTSEGERLNLPVAAYITSTPPAPPQ
ncbi:MAG: DUF1573 domain-containing protein [Abitibacteriaceae bacterium]|nr:DUF1573 domain-containing protein [Abditibacteriaceae bacterium]